MLLSVVGTSRSWRLRVTVSRVVTSLALRRKGELGLEVTFLGLLLLG